MPPPSLVPPLRSLPLLYTGKVREVYDAGGDRLLIVTSSRVSAFDVVFPEPVPHKAEVLNLLSAWWFERTRPIISNHLIETRSEAIFGPDAEECRTQRGRVALARRTNPVRFECVVRGHLDGSAWKEYQKTGRACGYELPTGLQRYDKLPRPLFTPATKAESGHDENITVEQLRAMAGEQLAARLEAASLALYQFAAEIVASKGLLLLDTKFEFGFVGGDLILIDECFTPDSSRYRTFSGEALDKQFLRDWLMAAGFTGDGVPPALPAYVINELSHRYVRVFEAITGTTIDEATKQHG